MTDERFGDDLLRAIRHLPPGSGIVFRHTALPRGDRHRLYLRVRRIAHTRRLLLFARGVMPAADGVHGPGGHGRRSWSVHSRRQAVAAAQRGATILFVSPVRETRSHPEAPPAGDALAAHWGRDTGTAVIALGGMDARMWLKVRRLGFDGWAGIDAWLPRQKRKAVPT